MTSIVTAATTLYLIFSSNDLQMILFNWMGLLGAIRHLAFVPLAAGSVKQAIEG